MAKNLGREFATMSEDERRRFALEEGGNASDTPEELDFDDPRDPDHMGKQYGSLKEEVADPDNRDGASALLDDEAHNREVERNGGSTGGQ
jgi:hypothetical protein